MTKSQQAAAAVGLRALGCEVAIETSGAEVALVLPDSPAEAAGLEPGDLIVEVDGTPVEGPEALRGVLAGVEPGDTVDVTYERDGKPVDVTVGTRGADDNPSRAVMGVQVDQGAAVDLPVEVTIDAKGVGGPSAGLVFALGIVDELGPDVDQGRKVVATGELALDGTVIPIGGIKQKTIAARQDGADIFVVPLDNAAEARRYADGLEIVPVRTFDEAVAALGVPADELAAAGCPA
jgi:PDZ domain-containing protein